VCIRFSIGKKKPSVETEGVKPKPTAYEKKFAVLSIDADPCILKVLKSALFLL
jgi:hypothetical protein